MHPPRRVLAARDRRRSTQIAGTRSVIAMFRTPRRDRRVALGPVVDGESSGARVEGDRDFHDEVTGLIEVVA
jgi:hypothetical protein